MAGDLTVEQYDGMERSGREQEELHDDVIRKRIIIPWEAASVNAFFGLTFGIEPAGLGFALPELVRLVTAMHAHASLIVRSLSTGFVVNSSTSSLEWSFIHYLYSFDCTEVSMKETSCILADILCSNILWKVVVLACIYAYVYIWSWIACGVEGFCRLRNIRIHFDSFE